jgi:hypothetical protein
MKPGFQKQLDISINHLTKADYDLLTLADQVEVPGQSTYRSMYLIPYTDGWIISTESLVSNPEGAEEKLATWKSQGFSDEFIALAKYCASEGAISMRFDIDGYELDDFPVFDMENGEKIERQQSPASKF